MFNTTNGNKCRKIYSYLNKLNSIWKECSMMQPHHLANFLIWMNNYYLTINNWMIKNCRCEDKCLHYEQLNSFLTVNSEQSHTPVSTTKETTNRINLVTLFNDMDFDNFFDFIHRTVCYFPIIILNSENYLKLLILKVKCILYKILNFR